MTTASQICSVLRADPIRWRLLGVVEALGLPDCWVGAGFVRNAVWDHLHQRPASPIDTDIDVIWHDSTRTEADEDRRLESDLRVLEPTFTWSVKNQARMHGRNGDAPYASATDAMRYWPETATAVAARRCGLDECQIAAPFGLEDLFALLLRPTPRFCLEKRAVYENRIRTKRWVSTWPLLKAAKDQVLVHP